MSNKTKVYDEDGKPLRRINPESRYWERLANELARSRVQIHPCRNCGGPVRDGYICNRCGCRNP